MNKRLLLAGLAFALGAGVAQTALAQAKPDTLVKQRQAAHDAAGQVRRPHGRHGARARSPTTPTPWPCNAAVPRRAEPHALGRLRAREQGRHREDRGAACGLERCRKFKTAQDNFQNAVQALVKVTAAATKPRRRRRSGGVGKTCGGCHQDFRENAAVTRALHRKAASAGLSFLGHNPRP